MEVPAVKFAACCLDKNTTAVNYIDELGYAIEAPAKSGNVRNQHAVERAMLPLGRFDEMHKTLASREGNASGTDVGLHKFFHNFPALFLCILSTCENLFCGIRIFRNT
jgi:hypothetical protein